MEKGLVCLVLHAHLPYVRHPEGEEYLEERWLYEGITETYVPLLQMLEKLVAEEVDFRITISLSPPLISMLRDQLVMKKYGQHLEGLMELATLEVERTRNMPEFNYTARLYEQRYRSIYRTIFEQNGGNLLNVFRNLMYTGQVELITSCATHGYLPLIGTQD